MPSLPCLFLQYAPCCLSDFLQHLSSGSSHLHDMPSARGTSASAAHSAHMRAFAPGPRLRPALARRSGIAPRPAPSPPARPPLRGAPECGAARRRGLPRLLRAGAGRPRARVPRGCGDTEGGGGDRVLTRRGARAPAVQPVAAAATRVCNAGAGVCSPRWTRRPRRPRKDPGAAGGGKARQRQGRARTRSASRRRRRHSGGEG